jgi:Domain of unknown function (DUF397)
LSENDRYALWQKSTFSGNGDCLWWRVENECVRLRDSKSDTEFSLTHTEWAAFVAGIKAGEADFA